MCVFAAGTAVGAGLFNRETGEPHPTATSRPSTAGIGGDQFGGTNPSTGVNAKLELEQKEWGTQVTLRLSGIRGPPVAELVAVTKSIPYETTAMSWTVPANGYGTAEQPDPLELHGGIALPPGEIYRLEVRNLNGFTPVVIPLCPLLDEYGRCR